jgi:hypothetical protein
LVAAESSWRSTPLGGLPTVNVITTGCAGRYSAFPPWVAVMLTVPVAPRSDTKVPVITAGPEFKLKVTGRPLDDETTRLNGALRVEMAIGST